MIKISPVELRQLEFKRVMRGVDANEVKTYLEQAADDIEALLLENERLKEELERYRELETDFKETAGKAQETAKSIIDKAKEEADSLIQDTRRKSEELQEQLNRLRVERNDFVAQFKKLLTSYLSMLEKETTSY